MTNNTEQRKTSEQAPRDAFDIWYNENVKYIEPVDVHAWCMAAWQAALVQREQEAPSLCTAEEAAELALSLGYYKHWVEDNCYEIAEIINADRAKR